MEVEKYETYIIQDNNENGITVFLSKGKNTLSVIQAYILMLNTRFKWEIYDVNINKNTNTFHYALRGFSHICFIEEVKYTYDKFNFFEVGTFED